MSDATRPSVVDELTDRLVAAIATGEFLPGTRLPPERDLAVMLGVGRTSVRAALARVHDAGLIDTQRGRGGGSFVREQWTTASHTAVLRTLRARWNEIEDRLEAMRRLHGTIALAAAERRDEGDVRILEERLDAYLAAPSGRLKQLADAALHVSIAEAAKNASLRDMLATLEREISIGAPNHVWGEPESMAAGEERAAGEHIELVTAIRERRAEDAARIAREHGRIDLELLEAARRRAERGGDREQSAATRGRPSLVG